MSGNDDDFTAEELANFQGVGDDEAKAIERYLKWAGQKENRAASESRNRRDSQPSPGGSPASGLTLDGLAAMVDSPKVRSILKHLLAEAEASPPIPRKAAPKPGEPAEPARKFRLL